MSTPPLIAIGPISYTFGANCNSQGILSTRFSDRGCSALQTAIQYSSQEIHVNDGNLEDIEPSMSDVT